MTRSLAYLLTRSNSAWTFIKKLKFRPLPKITPSQVTLYVWRSDDRLLEVKQGVTEATSRTLAKYQYDDTGNRIQRVTGEGVITDYLTDTNFNYAQILEEKENNQLTRYEWGLGLIKADGSNNQKFYHADGLGSIVALTNLQGEVSQSYEYEAFGRLTKEIDNTQDTNRYRYTGEYGDTVIGEQYNRARCSDLHLKPLRTAFNAI